METLRKLASGAIAAVALTTAAYAGEPRATPKHLETIHSWLPRDYFKVDRGRAEDGVGEPRGETSALKPHVPRNGLGARLWIPGVGCTGAAVAFDAAALRGVPGCFAAATSPTVRPDWIAIAIETMAGNRAASPLTS